VTEQVQQPPLPAARGGGGGADDGDGLLGFLPESPLNEMTLNPFPPCHEKNKIFTK
jgi:hypothetical protein